MNQAFATEAAQTGVLFPTERHVGQVNGGDVVDMRHACFQTGSKALCPVGVTGEDRTGKTKLGVVGHVQRLGVIGERKDRRDGAKQFAATQRHLRGNAIEDVRRHDQAVRRATQALPSAFCMGGRD
ncbi:hypothetical protein D9M71_804310 [compost metagenome]